MDEIVRRVEEARECLDPRWDAVRTEVALAQLEARLRRRRRSRRLLAVAAAAALVLGSAVAAVALRPPDRGAGRPPAAAAGAAPAAQPGARSAPGAPAVAAAAPTSSPAPAPAAPPHGTMPAEAPAAVVRFADRSTATPLTPETRLVTTEVSATGIAVRIEAGAARFDVTPNAARRFRVAADGVVVDVVGTSFTVRREAERVRVDVHRGWVRIDWRTGEQLLAAGEGGLFPPEGVAVAVAPPAPPAAAAPPPPPGPGRAPPAGEAPAAATGGETAPSWRDLARQGDYGAAWAALEREPATGGDMEDLLLAADVARIAGRAERAAAWLRRAIDEHPGDPRAPVAAFTLGRVLLQPLDRPAEAAAAFARSRTLSPAGALAEDALAREVEAWARAGDGARAREAAAEYLLRYPEGRHAAAVRQQGGPD